VSKAKKYRAMTTSDVRVWVCDGHRPAHDSAPLEHGTQMTLAEWWRLRNLIGKYYDSCRRRREHERRIALGLRTMVRLSTGRSVPVDRDATLQDVKRAEPGFFATKHGKRETYAMYRGFLIVRGTRTYSDNKPRRETSVYLFSRDLEGGRPGTLCVDVGVTHKDAAAARRHVDRILETGLSHPHRKEAKT
jgi:hypothetical protein